MESSASNSYFPKKGILKKKKFDSNQELEAHDDDSENRYFIENIVSLV
jgi:hypothetical protein